MQVTRVGKVRVVVVALAALLSGPASARAQGGGSISPAMDRAIARARSAVDAGDGADARAILDSLVAAAPSGGNDLAEALFWRATLAERVSESERDWKRLVIEAPLAPRATDALQRLGELEMLRGHPAEARTYFARIVREYPGAARARSQLWIAKSWVAQRDLPRACVALADASTTGVPEGELRLQADELGRQCATVDRKLIAKVVADTVAAGAVKEAPKDTPKDTPRDAPAEKSKESVRETARAKKAVPANARYSVQLAAFDTRDEGEALVQRLAGQGIDARVDGDAKPFRVRSGYYATRAQANAALASLKRRGQPGFVAEIAK
jgi:cell division septation protein DedD